MPALRATRDGEAPLRDVPGFRAMRDGETALHDMPGFRATRDGGTALHDVPAFSTTRDGEAPLREVWAMSAVLLLSLAGLALVDSTSFGTLGIPVFLLLTTFAVPVVARDSSGQAAALSPETRRSGADVNRAPKPDAAGARESDAYGGQPGDADAALAADVDGPSVAGRGASRGIGRLLVYLGTVAGCYFVLGVLLMTGAGAVAEPLGRVLGGETGRWVELVAGVALFAVSFRFDSKRAARRGESRLVGRLTGGPGAMVALGLTATAVEAATMLPYLGALGLMTAAGLPAVQWVPLLAAYVLVMIVPALLLIVVRLTAGRRVQSLLERIGAFIRKHSASAIGWALGIAGFLLARDAAAHLFFTN